jgi:hypothetical protein
MKMLSKLRNEFQILSNGKQYKVTRKENDAFKDCSNHQTYEEAAIKVNNIKNIQRPTPEQWDRAGRIEKDKSSNSRVIYYGNYDLNLYAKNYSYKGEKILWEPLNNLPQKIQNYYINEFWKFYNAAWNDFAERVKFHELDKYPSESDEDHKKFCDKVINTIIKHYNFTQCPKVNDRIITLKQWIDKKIKFGGEICKCKIKIWRLDKIDFYILTPYGNKINFDQIPAGNQIDIYEQLTA